MDKLKFFCNGQYIESKTEQYSKVYNPSTGEATALCPNCTAEELEQ